MVVYTHSRFKDGLPKIPNPFILNEYGDELKLNRYVNFRGYPNPNIKYLNSSQVDLIFDSSQDEATLATVIDNYKSVSATTTIQSENKKWEDFKKIYVSEPKKVLEWADFNSIYNAIKTEYTNVGFSNLVEIDKRIAAKWNIATKSERESVYSVSELEAWRTKFVNDLKIFGTIKSTQTIEEEIEALDDIEEYVVNNRFDPITGNMSIIKTLQSYSTTEIEFNDWSDISIFEVINHNDLDESNYNILNNYEIQFTNPINLLIQSSTEVKNDKNRTNVYTIMKVDVANGNGYVDVSNSMRSAYVNKSNFTENIISPLVRLSLPTNAKLKVQVKSSNNDDLILITSSLTLINCNTLIKDQAPSITSEITVIEVELGDTYTYQMTAIGKSLTWSLYNHPSGMTINTQTGLISYTPNTVGVYDDVQIVATNGSGSDSILVDFESVGVVEQTNIIAHFRVNEVESSGIKDNEKVDYWNSIVGTYKLSQNIKSNYPKFQSDEYGIYGFVEGNGDDYLRINTAIDLTDTFSIFIVAYTSEQYTERLLISDDLALNSIGVGNTKTIVKINGTSNSDTLVTSWYNDLAIIHVSRDMNDDVYIAFNGGNDTLLMNKSSTFTINYVLGNGLLTWKCLMGHICEIIIYDNKLTGTPLTDLNSMLITKYNI